MLRLQGIAVSPGVAIGEALVLDNEGFRIPRRFIAREVVETELERLDRAITTAGDEIEGNRIAITRELGDQYGAIFSAHLQMLRDPRLRGELEEMIRDRRYTAEYSVSRALRRYAKVFQNVESSYLAERANDIFDIEKRLLRNLLGGRREELSHVTSPVLVLAHNLSPSETANLNRTLILGFATEIGGAGSHTAIVAEGMEIPAVVGIGNFLTDVSGGDQVIVDGNEGLLILQPDEETLAQYHQEVADSARRVATLESIRELPAETLDGVRVQLLANIEFPHEVEQVVQRGADGVGLYRTEFLYLGAETAPTEEDQFRAYSQVAQALSGKPVIIRTLDLGADKVLQNVEPSEDRNPVLGLRSIRLSLKNVPLFRTQLRAVLRASSQGDVRLMFPLISTLLELRKAKMILADVMEDLAEEGIPFNRKMPVGMMVEVPAAVVMIDAFAAEVDFISVGTNDLTQYTLAVDRDNKDVAELYTAAEPAIRVQLEQCFRAAERRGIDFNVCGQMSSSITYTMLLLGLGLRRFSVTPKALPEVKKVVRSVTLQQCEELADRVRGMENARNIRSLLRETVRSLQDQGREEL